MLILSLDTSTRAGSVAVIRDGDLLALVRGDTSRTHGERLPAEIAAALEQAGVSRDALDLLAVAAGPGGFTGLRIGLAAIQGLAMTLGKPVAGVSTLDALAEQAAGTAGDFIVPWMDAQRGDVFATLIDARSGAVLAPPVAEHPQVVLDRYRAWLDAHDALFIGDAVTRDAALIAASGSGVRQMRTPDPLAPQIAALGARLAGLGQAGPPHALAPIYIRRPDAEIERERGRATADVEPDASEQGGA